MTSFITAHIAKIVGNRDGINFIPGRTRTYYMFTCWLRRYDVSAVLLVHKLQAAVYDILPSTTDVFSYVIGSRKLSANEQFFVGTLTLVSLLQATQIKQGVSFIDANKVYSSKNNAIIFRIATELFVRHSGGTQWLRACFVGTNGAAYDISEETRVLYLLER